MAKAGITVAEVEEKENESVQSVRSSAAAKVVPARNILTHGDANASAPAILSDKTLATHGKIPYYWYSVKDGHILSIDIRQRLLSEYYTVSYDIVVNPGEEYASTRENNLGIFISDPYYFKSGEVYFSNYLNSDLNKITKQGAFAGIATRAWGKLPDKLIIPVLSGAHWRVVCAQIDYGERAEDSSWIHQPNLTIIINDPYGASNISESLEAGLVEALRLSVMKLVNFHHKTVCEHLEVTSVIKKDFDQQGIGQNSWDCGPITFKNIEDYASAAISGVDLSGFEDFSIKAPLSVDHSAVVKQVRDTHIGQYTNITGVVAAINEAHDAEITGWIHKEVAEKSSSIITKDAYLESRILELLPEEKMQFFATLDAIRESKKSSEQSSSDDNTQEDIAYALSLVYTENSPFAYQLKQHIKTSFGKISELKDDDIKEQINRIFISIQDPSMESVFKNATDFLTHSVKTKLINHIINNLKIDLLRLLPEVWSSYLALAKNMRSKVATDLKEQLGVDAQLSDNDDGIEDTVLDLYNDAVESQRSIDPYNSILRHYVSTTEAYSKSYKQIMDNYLSMSVRAKYLKLQEMHPITIPELFWLFHKDFDDSKKIAKLKEVITKTKDEDFAFFRQQVNLMNLLYDALQGDLQTTYKDILDRRQEIIQQHIANLPSDLQQLEIQFPGIVGRFVTALMTAKSLKNLLDFGRDACPELFNLIDEVITSNNLGELITAIENAGLRHTEDSFYCEELQRNFFQVEEIKIASSYMRQHFLKISDTEGKFSDPVFSDPHDIQKLVNFCRGDEDSGLDWLVADLLEYTYSLMDDLVEEVLKLDMSRASGVGINKKGLNHELAYFVVGMLINQPEYKEQSIYDYTFIKAAYASAVKKLQLMTSAEIRHELCEFVKFKNAILSDIDQEFNESIKAFNKAWDQHDLLTIQREWYKLSAKLNIWAISQIIGNQNLEYDSDIEEMFDNKATKHYRILPAIDNEEGIFTITYKSKHHPSKDDIPLDITEIFSSLKHRVDSVNQAIATAVHPGKAKAHNTTNFVSSELIFIVGSEPHDNKTDAYKRLFVKVPVKLDGSTLISLSDVVSAPRAHDFLEYLNIESEKGIEALGSRSPKLNKKDKFCSERALFESFKKPEFTSAIVTKLHDAVDSDARFQKMGSHKFKVYGMVLAEYSTLTSCDKCCGATVSQHLKKGTESFLPILEQSINSHNGTLHFFTKGSNKGISKFNMMTFVASGQSSNTQTDDVSTSVGNPTYNSATQIFFERDSLDLSIHLSFRNVQPLVEFPDFVGSVPGYFGSVYMSGASKAEKYDDGVEVVLAGLDA